MRGTEDLSPGARALVDAAFADVDRSLLWDVHAHVVGMEGEGNGTWVHPHLSSHLHPLQRLRFDVYLAASGVEAGPGADEAYVERLLALHRAMNPAGKLLLLAFDARIAADGAVDLEHSQFVTPDEYVLRLAREHADVAACASVHPYRTDAVERLERAAAAGTVCVKWLPNAMGIDPASPACDAFYAKLVELGLVLLTHTGTERAVHAEEDQALGNPLRLRRALDAGVRVVAAHSGSLGRDEDLDLPAAERRALESFDLFLRLMGEKEYEGRLFGELSAVTFVNRSERVLRELLCATELHPRFVNGSDYPLPAIDYLVSTRLLVHRGLLAGEDRAPLGEIFEANPLLFDYVLKRRLRVEGEEGTRRFAPIAFETGRLFVG